MVSTTRPEIATIRELRPTDEGQVLTAFNLVNEAQNANFMPRAGAEWRWRYLANPAGCRCTLGLDESGRVLAQYAGLPQHLMLEGQLVTVTQGVDSFSIPSVRGLGKRGAFVSVGEPFAEQYGGLAGHGDPWMWGFPVPTARRVGERFLGYRTFRAQPLLELDREPSTPDQDEARLADWIELDRRPQDFEAIFAQQQALYPAIADRRGPALAWRYAQHPKRRYQLLVQLDGDGSVRGYAVVTLARFEGRDLAVLCDAASLDEDDGGLIRAAWRFASRVGRLPLVAALPPWTASFGRYQDFGFRVRSSSLTLVGRSYDRAYPSHFWRSNWYTTLGDSDLC